ncbi:class I SAM-dependent methyltransferase [Nonomuraea sp. NN258]|uniref:class I SAM-dependent methyltransferase n=1 Tax=Nonomuraea antri TaxID=2730852 RepID=UPI001568F664|nr:class I SAM-dependent methyltransferase [Nonomuraea antri]NRQ37091.1 class I SAM-dependent methyltransferase [Nonomuraea antri]
MTATTALTGLAAYWDRYAIRKPSPPPGKALKDGLLWTPYEDHGPGEELLGNPASVLELGCSHGNAAAALAVKGIDVTGVDLSPVMIASARARWGHLPHTVFIEADALGYLARARRRWEAIYSIWGALWFLDPEQWMPLVRTCLAPDGRLVFSCAAPVPGCYGVQGMYGAGFTGPQTYVRRWAYEPEIWAKMLTEHGFCNVDAWVEPAPEPDHLGTLIIRAQV